MKILFHGDSITDSGRDKENHQHMGHGYATMVAGELGLLEPGKYQFFNRGHNGYTVCDILKRWEEDFLTIRPDFISISVGVNDAGYFATGEWDVDANQFREQYAALLDRIRTELPSAGILLILPYIMRNMQKTDTQEMKYPMFRPELEKRQEQIIQLAEERKIPFINLQACFDKAVMQYPGELFAADSIHPTPAGHVMIKNAWIAAFQQLYI